MSKLVVSIDPGDGTGFVIHRVAPKGEPIKDMVTGCFMNEGEEYHARLYNWLRQMAPDVIVCERFNYQNVSQGGVEMPGVSLMSRDYIGVIKLYVQLRNDADYPPVRLIMRNPGQAFDVWTNDKLKKLGYYTKGQKNTNGAPHINDAMRHMMGFLVDAKRFDYLEALKPTS